MLFIRKYKILFSLVFREDYNLKFLEMFLSIILTDSYIIYTWIVLFLLLLSQWPSLSQVNFKESQLEPFNHSTVHV